MARSKKSAKTRTHPWRPCPLGKHWVSAHSRTRTSSKGKEYTQSVKGHCRTGRSHKDHLYKADLIEISSHFSALSGPPKSNNLGFGAQGNKYDSLIRGWTQYWNDVLKPKELLDADLVKALIASESSFNPKKWNRIKGKNGAYGLTQVLNRTVALLKDPNELKDHLLNLTEDDMLDPNLNICAGIRWLFRKKDLAEAKAKRKLSWRDAVAEYKGITPDEKRLMPRFDGYLNDLRKTK